VSESGGSPALVTLLRKADPIEEALLELPAASGLYAWWQRPNALPNVLGTPHPGTRLQLLYVGIAPDKPRPNRPTPTRPSNLRRRIRGQHLSNRLAGSTLRRALAAFLWEQHGWSPTFSKKVEITPENNRELTAWMTQNLHLAWAAHPTPWCVEAALVREMYPPLNWEHNEMHEFRPELKRAGDAFRAAGKRASAGS
jgi:hypothetical protein